MTTVNIFGTRLAELAGLQSFHGIGLLRLAIKDAGLDPDGVVAYPDMKTIIQNHVRKRLVTLKTPNTDDIIRQLLLTLSEKQSLFTLAAR